MHASNRIARSTLLAGLAWWGVVTAAAAEQGPSAADCFIPALKTGNADAVAACYAEDAIMWFPGGPMAKGRTAIREGFARFLASTTIKEVALNPLGQEALGDSRVSWGTYSLGMVDKSSGVESLEQGRYTDVSKQINGRWLYIVDHPSVDPAEAQPDSE